MDEQTLHNVLSFIVKTIEETDVIPTQREIAEACYISKGTVSNYLNHLEELGYIGRHKGQQRNIYIKFENVGRMVTNL